MVLNEISMALKGFKAAVEITKTILNMSKDVSLSNKIIELQNVILSLHSEYGKLIEVKDQLEKELMEYENWDKTKSQYDLKEVAPGVLVYASQKGDQPAEPQHWLCTNCFNDKKKSILQFSKDVRSGRYYSCPKCKTEIRTPSDKPPGGRSRIVPGWR